MINKSINPARKILVLFVSLAKEIIILITICISPSAGENDCEI